MTSFVVLYLNAYVRDLSVTWALTLNILWKEDIMHSYLIFIVVPSTAPLLGESGLNSNSKIRVIGKTKASNSSSACSKAAKKLNVPYSKLKALLVRFNKDGGLEMEKHEAGGVS